MNDDSFSIDSILLNMENMTVPELNLLLERLNDRYDVLAGMEPEDEDSEEYEAWESELEDIDDLMDDIQDRLDELS